MRQDKKLILGMALLFFITFVTLGTLVVTEKLAPFYTDKIEKKFINYINKNYKDEKENFKIGKITYKATVYKVKVTNKNNKDLYFTMTYQNKKIKSTYKVGDMVSEEVTPKSFGRIAAQTARQVVMQRLNEAEKGNIAAELNTKGDQITTAIVRNIDAKNVYLELGGVEAEGVLNENDQIPGEKFEIGDRVKVYIKRVKESNYGSLVQVSRTNVGFVKKLFELEIPEVESGEVQIKNIVREPGFRTKIAIFSSNPNLDPVGVCVGQRGTRINAIVSELNGEKIDIIPWSQDIFEYIAAALSPAEVISVEINEDEKSSKVIVPDNKLSLAIGKEGMNVRLAARLTGWKIDVKSESSAAKSSEKTEPKEVNFEEISTDGSDLFDDVETIV